MLKIAFTWVFSDFEQNSRNQLPCSGTNLLPHARIVVLMQSNKTKTIKTTASEKSVPFRLHCEDTKTSKR